MKRSFILFAIGLVYGTVLAFLGLVGIGAKNGTAVPLAIFGSPLLFPFAFFAPIAFWPIVGLMLGAVEERAYKRVFLGLMVLHYAGIVPYLVITRAVGSFSLAFAGSPGTIIFGFIIYIAGQISIWEYYVDRKGSILD